MKREGNNPKRRVVSSDQLPADKRAELARRVQYAGSGHHKRFPADYGLERPSPRPTKSLCDLTRVITKEEAKALIHNGIICGMVSAPIYQGFPKFIWSVDSDGEVYEAKTDPKAPVAYHGYRLEEEDDMRKLIKAEWEKRCPQVGR
jgi:hypothetical protein